MSMYICAYTYIIGRRLTESSPEARAPSAWSSARRASWRCRSSRRSTEDQQQTYKHISNKS